MIESFSRSLRKHVRDESVPYILRKGSEDISGLLYTAGYERQPFQGDHRVAAPVCEPVIAGKDRAFFVAIGMRPRRILEAVRGVDDELISGKYKIRAEGRERLAGLFDQTLTPVAFSGKRLRRRQGIDYSPILYGRNECYGRAYFEIDVKGPRTIQIARRVVAA